MASRTMPTGAAPRREYPSDERVIELVDARRRHSLRYNQSLFSKLPAFYNTFRGYWQRDLSQFRNRISIPFTFAMIMSDVARKAGSVFGQWPIVGFEGYAPEDSARAKKREVLISAQMKDCDSFLKAVDLFLQADICGTGVARYGWKQISRKTKVRQRESILGMEIVVAREYEAEVFNGPDWDTVDRLDFWQQPGKRRIQDMGWVIHRYWEDWDDLMENATGPYPYFEAPAVRRLQQFPMQGSAAAEYTQRRLTFRNEMEYLVRQQERFAKPVEIWEMHGLVPDEFAKDGIRSRCIAIGNGQVVLKNRESFLPSGAKPFLSYAPMPDPYGFDGIGKAEVAFGPQLTADRLNNQKLDAIDLVIDPMYVASNKANLPTQHLFTRAGRVLLVDGAADESNIRALQPNLSGIQMAYSEIGQMFQFMQLGTGETESLLGVSSGNRETARGFLGRQENALTRLAMEERLAEEGFVEKLANGFVDMDRLWLKLPHEVKILGSMAMTNPVTGLPYPPEPITVDFDDLQPDYRARAIGASTMTGRNVKQQNAIQLLQFMSANPALAQLVNWSNFARQMFQLFDFPNVTDLLVTQVPMINALAQQNGMSPQSVAQTVSQPLDQLSPEILGRLQGGQTSPSPLAGIA